MTTAHEVDGTSPHERERREADRRYNDALTALDREIVAINESATPARDMIARTMNALIIFLQHITAFVEAKDREIAADVAARMAVIERALEPIAELRTQINVLQRAVQGIVRTANSQTRAAPPPLDRSATSFGPPSLGESTTSSGEANGYKYVAFEDHFRGSTDAIAERVRGYVPIFAAAADAVVVDLGCGRGELLNALTNAGLRARGVDSNADMVGIARDRGLDAVHADALTFLSSVDDGALGGIIATQVVEHLEPQYLLRLLDASAAKLRHGAPLVIETINPACWLAFFSSYIRDFTHVRPLHPETLQYLLRASGFERVELRYSAPVPGHMKMKTVDLPADFVADRDSTAIAMASIAHALNANSVILNNLMFTHLDYAAIGYKS